MAHPTGDGITLTSKGSVYLPARDRWGEDAHVAAGDFDLDPLRCPAASTSGSPVLLADGLFVGVTDPNAAVRFTRQGDQLQITGPAESLMVVEGQDPFVSWRRYHQHVALRSSPPNGESAQGFERPDPSEARVEYCTWVEQRAAAHRLGGSPPQRLDQAFVVDYLDRIDALDLPRGLVTVDDGWAPQCGPGGVGDWEPDPASFPDLAVVVDEIRARGHTAGLWLALGRACITSRALAAGPMTAIETARTEIGETKGRMTHERYLLPDQHFARHCEQVLRRYHDLGFTKFKIDLCYGPKHLMTEQLRLMWEATRSLPGPAELEHHVPDVFAARWGDVIRTNDVLIKPDRDWRGLARSHWIVSSWSCPDRLLNLDHIGGNDPTVTAAEFTEHHEMLAAHHGHPVVSLLPDRFDDDTVATFATRLRDYLATGSDPRPRPSPMTWADVVTMG